MRLLLDESLPKKLRASPPGHSVSTVVEMGWGGTKNGALLALASSQFDAFLTADQNLPYQQNAESLPLTVIVLCAKSNTLSNLLPLIPLLRAALSDSAPKSLTRIELTS